MDDEELERLLIGLESDRVERKESLSDLLVAAEIETSPERHS
jgi:hypothetical protein